jgi:hypothetical protein
MRGWPYGWMLMARIAQELFDIDAEGDRTDHRVIGHYWQAHLTLKLLG